MDPTILIALLAFGGLYLFARTQPSSSGTLPSQPVYPTPINPPFTYVNPHVSRNVPMALDPGNVNPNAPRPAGPGAIAAGVTTSVAATAATGAGFGTGFLGLGAYAIPIVGGLAALTTWGVASKGWFRGGWEGVKGNNIRDKFFQQFVDSYFPGAGSERQYEAVVNAYRDIEHRGDQLGILPRIDGDVANRQITALYQADSEDEMKRAMRTIQATFARVGITIQSL